MFSVVTGQLVKYDGGNTAITGVDNSGDINTTTHEGAYMQQLLT
jgi:hypothetical protein